MHCEYCKQLISRKNIRKIAHHNIALSEDALWFCSKKCYEKWLRDIQVKKLKTYFIWKTAYIFGRLNFVKQIIQVKGVSNDYGASTENSHFSKELS